MLGSRSVNVTLRDSTMEKYLDTSRSNIGVTDMADRSRCRSGTLVLAIWDKSGSVTVLPDESEGLDRSPGEDLGSCTG
jgi:hypothetical protein